MMSKIKAPRISHHIVIGLYIADIILELPKTVDMWYYQPYCFDTILGVLPTGTCFISNTWNIWLIAHVLITLALVTCLVPHLLYERESVVRPGIHERENVVSPKRKIDPAINGYHRIFCGMILLNCWRLASAPTIIALAVNLALVGILVWLQKRWHQRWAMYAYFFILHAPVYRTIFIASSHTLLKPYILGALTYWVSYICCDIIFYSLHLLI